MKFIKITLVFTLLLTFTSCFKTAEEIKREQMVDNLAIQMVQNQKLTAELSVKIQGLQDRFGEFTGNMEEEEHKKYMSSIQRIQAIEEKVLVQEQRTESLNQKVDENVLTLEKIQAQLAEQQKYLDTVLKSLKKLTKVSTEMSLSPYDKAINHYKKGRYAKARTQFLDLLDDKSIKGNKKARLIHNLGMIAYMDKDFDKALVYFSKLFTQYPEAPYNKNGLLFLAKTFKSLQKKKQALQTIDELIKRYPKWKGISKAKKLKKSLQ
jgi:TolA-binding protein